MFAPQFTFLRSAIVVSLLLTGWPSFAQAIQPGAPETVVFPELEPRLPLYQELTGKEQVQTFILRLRKGDYAHVQVRANGVLFRDVKLFAPSGQRITNMQFREEYSGEYETEHLRNGKVRQTEIRLGRHTPQLYPLGLIAKESGKYTIRVEARNMPGWIKGGRDIGVALGLPERETIERPSSTEQEKRDERVYPKIPIIGKDGHRGTGTTVPPPDTPYYQVVLVAYRPTPELEKGLEAARDVFARAQLLQQQRTPAAARQAVEKYTEALQMWRALGDQAKEAATLNALGETHFQLAEYDTARTHFQQANELWRDLRDLRGLASSTLNLGETFYRLEQYALAVEQLNQTLPWQRELKDANGEARVLQLLGQSHLQTNQPPAAMTYLRQALALFRQRSNQRGEAQTLLAFGTAYDLLGEKQLAQENLLKGLRLAQSLADERQQGLALSALGKVVGAQGDYQQALEYHTQALRLQKKLKDSAGEAQELNALGHLNLQMGEYKQARSFFQDALARLTPLGAAGRAGRALALAGLGNVATALDEATVALDALQQALALRKELADPRGEAMVLHDLGRVYFDLKQYQEALQAYQAARTIQRTLQDRAGEAQTLTNLGRVYAALQETDRAQNHYLQALTLRRAVRDPQGEALTLYQLAQLERQQGRLSEARNDLETALKRVEALRAKIASQELRTSYFASVQQMYEAYIDTLMQLHEKQPNAKFDWLALQASERARARSLIELLIEAGAHLRQGGDETLLKTEQQLQRRLNEKAAVLLQASASATQNPELEKEIDALTQELAQVRTTLRQTSPRYAALTQPQPLDVIEMQGQLLDDQTLLLEFALGEERSYLWALTQNSFQSFVLPKRAEIEAVARQVYDALTARNTLQRGVGLAPKTSAQAEEEYWQAATKLSHMILAPVAPQWGKKRLLIVADGALQYLPFVALPEPLRAVATAPPPPRRAAPRPTQPATPTPLLVNHEVVSLPSLTTLATLRQEMQNRPRAPKLIAALADPVFDPSDERVKQIATAAPSETTVEQRSLSRYAAFREPVRSAADKAVTIPRLPSTRLEAEAVLALAPAGLGRIALDFQANRSLALSPELAQYRYLLFATHGWLDAERPELSALILSLLDEQGRPQEGFLRSHEIYNLNLPAELVVLSACETGLGKQIKGEGLVGLTRGFMYAGAARVAVSLWEVSDKGTMELMTRFHRKLLAEGQRPAAALRAAQLELWQQKKWASPYYWASFVLQGEWK